MKKLTWALSALLLIPILACQLPQTGGVRVVLPAPRTVVANSGDGDLVRIQLRRNGVVVPLQGKSFLEQGLAGQVVTLSELLPGSGYTLAVVTGEKKAKGYFEVAYFKTSQAFEITAGVDTSVTVSLEKAPFALIEAESGRHAVVAMDGTLVYLNGDTLKTTAGQEQSIASLSGKTIRSLGVVNQPKEPYGTAVFVNTDQGLAFWQPGEGLSVPTMKHNVKVEDANGKEVDTPTDFTTAPDIRFSGAFSAFDTTDATLKNTVYAYGGEGLTAGLVIVKSNSKDTNTLADLVWYDLDEMLKLDDMQEIKDSLSGGKPVVTGFATAPTYSWLATALATFRIDSSLVGGSADDLGDDFLNDESLQIEAYLDGRTVNIDVVGAVDGRGYAGTSRGLFTAAVDARGIVMEGSTKVNVDVGTDEAPDIVEKDKSGPLKLIPATKNQTITTLAAAKFGGNAYAAAYVDSTRELLILKEDAIIAQIPRLAGLPTGDLRFAWYQQDGALKLAIAGDDATVSYTAAP